MQLLSARHRHLHIAPVQKFQKILLTSYLQLFEIPLSTLIQRKLVVPSSCEVLLLICFSRMPFSNDPEEMVIGVEATAYLQTIMEENPEPLLAALGGFPLVLRENIETELNKWKENNMRPVFIFEGQPIVGQDEMTLRNAKTSLEITQSAWHLYGENKPTDAVTAFGASGILDSIRPLSSSDVRQVLFVFRNYIPYYKTSYPNVDYPSRLRLSGPVPW